MPASLDREVVLALDRTGYWWPGWVVPANETPDNIERLAESKAKASKKQTVVVLWLGWGTKRYFYAVIDDVNAHQ